jgi:hypothetical protein
MNSSTRSPTRPLILRLRKAGVRVLTKEESFKTPGVPDLSVNLNTLFFIVA